MEVCKTFFLLLFGTIIISETECRAVNISNTWTLPQEGFSVFYRFFRDKISWFEADAVCQFHHANLVTVENGLEFDATRAFLKELDVTEPVWIGLMRPQNSGRFTWTNSKPLDTTSGYWAESIPVFESPLCAVIDPVRDFRWHSLRCGGPETAAFLCEMNVPDWATECEVRAMPSLTVQYMSDSGTIQLSRDCGEAGTRHMTCKGKQDHDEILKQLICTDETSVVSENNIAPSSLSSSSSSSLPETVTTTTTTIVTPMVRLDNKMNQKVISHILNVPSDNNEENNIDINANTIETSVEKVFDKFNVEDELMQGDQPMPTIKRDEKEKIKPLDKKLNKMGGKKTKDGKKFDKKIKLIEDVGEEELMLGDQPPENSIANSQEIPLPHEKKAISVNLGLGTTIKLATVQGITSEIISSSTFLPTELPKDTTIESITSTTIMVSTTDDGRPRRGTEIDLTSTIVPMTVTTTIVPTTTELIENVTEHHHENHTHVEINNAPKIPQLQNEIIVTSNPPILSETTTKTTTKTTAKATTTSAPIELTESTFQRNSGDDAMHGSGHPIHIPQSILRHNDDITIRPHRLRPSTYPPPRTTQRNVVSEDHFIPPMLLVKAQFTSTKSHSENVISDSTSPLTTKLHGIDELTVSPTMESSVTSPPPTTTTINFESTSEIINEKTYSLVENGTVIDVLDLSDKILFEKVEPTNVIEKDITPTTMTTDEQHEEENRSSFQTSKVVINNNLTQDELNEYTSIPPIIETTSISPIQGTTKLEIDEIKSSLNTELPYVTVRTILSTDNDEEHIDDELLSTTIGSHNATPIKGTLNPVDPLSLLSSSSSVTGSVIVEDIPAGTKTTTTHYENNFSNIENFQPYRPNRHRILTQPDSSHQSVIKKILG